jgi:hypothetical protein
MDAKDLLDVSCIPTNAVTDRNPSLNDNMSATEASAGTIHDIAGSASTAAPVTDSNSVRDEASEISTSLENLSIVINSDTSTPAQSSSTDIERTVAVATSDDITVSLINIYLLSAPLTCCRACPQFGQVIRTRLFVYWPKNAIPSVYRRRTRIGLHPSL